MGTRLEKTGGWRQWGVVKTYRNFGRLTQTILALSLALGIFVFFVLWAADVGYQLRIGTYHVPTYLQFDWLRPEWQHSHAYIPNILAGLTSFLIGVPIALTVLDTFTGQREETEALKRVNEMSELAWGNFLTAYRAFYTPERLNSLTNGAVEANAHHNTAFNYAVSFINLMRLGHVGDVMNEKPVRTIADAHREIKECYEAFNDAVDPITVALVNRDTIETQWSAVTGAWQTLDQFIRLQRLGQRLEWFIPNDPVVDAEMRKLLSRSPNPLAEFAEIHGHSANTPGAARTMVNTVNTVKNYGSWSEAELRKYLSADNPQYFGYSFVAYYGNRAQEASIFLTSLNDCVTSVIESGWPRTAKHPRR